MTGSAPQIPGLLAVERVVDEEHVFSAVGSEHALAVLSPDCVYRYVLRRFWLPDDDDPLGCLFVCLNPSTADAYRDDPTVRRLVGFARGWGYSSLTVCNLFAYRATDPRALYDTAGAEGDPENVAHIEREALRAELVVAAWGAHGALRGRGDKVMRRLAAAGPVHVLGLTKDGQPRHPLYMRGDAQPQLLHEKGGG